MTSDGVAHAPRPRSPQRVEIMRATVGTGNAARLRVRAVLLVLLTGCFSSSMRPAVIPKLSELPVVEDPGRSKGVLESAHAQPGPEQQPKSKGARKVETAAATAAAWIGILLSDHENVTLGGSATFDENHLVDPQPEQKKPAKPAPAEKHDEPLVPWIQLK
jgi:hypothetical protein